MVAGSDAGWTMRAALLVVALAACGAPPPPPWQGTYQGRLTEAFSCLDGGGGSRDLLVEWAVEQAGEALAITAPVPCVSLKGWADDDETAWLGRVECPAQVLPGSQINHPTFLAGSLERLKDGSLSVTYMEADEEWTNYGTPDAVRAVCNGIAWGLLVKEGG